MELPQAQTRVFTPLREHIWRAPLVPVALALTLGILLDRALIIPLLFSFAISLAALLAWMANSRRDFQWLSLFYLWTTCAGVGATFHHYARHGVADNDIRHLAVEEAKPARLRGVVASEPNFARGSKEDPLRSFPGMDSTKFVLQVTQLKTSYDWLEVSGQAQVILQAKIHPVHAGDRVEIVGRMALPGAPANPGEFDYEAFLQDQGIGVVVHVPPSSDGIKLLAEDWPRTLGGWLAVIRGWGQGVLSRCLPENVSGVAGALLLGEGSGMTGEDWDKYVRTGVIHVLAISGQHLVILGCFLWGLIRLCGIPGRRGALLIAAFLFLYALLTGARPPTMRAAWVMAVFCGGMLVQRPTLPANAFALGWIGVLGTNPTDIFNMGCQLSFLAVAVLIWGTHSAIFSSAFLMRVSFNSGRIAIDPNLQKVIDESQPLIISHLIRFWRWLGEFYLVNVIVWLAVTPLVAGTQHLITPVALLIGPPLVLLTSVALLAGFMTLLAAPLGLARVFSWTVHWSLAGCEYLVDGGAAIPGAFFYVPDIPPWWVWIFYLALFAYLTVGWVGRRPLTFAGFCLLWVSLGTLIALGVFRQHGFCCAFLAVGHGGCTVLETAQGRVLLYDAGAMAGPDLTRRHIAPYLWHRGIRHIDELFVSHADLDHFNGVTALLDRFAVSRVTLTPSFADRLTPAVQGTLAQLQKRGTLVRVAKAGDPLSEGSLSITVLHPPARGPEGNENTRSLVLYLRQEDLALLLTGDLEGAGLERMLAQERLPIDILMAPHHGSKTSNKAELANWARPKVAISSQGPPRGNPQTANPYESRGANYLTTWKEGAVTIQKEEGTWTITTHRTKKNFQLSQFFP